MQIEIPEPLFKRLQKHATPLVDTPVSVIERWADFFEEHHGKNNTQQNASNLPVESSSSEKLQQIDLINPPSLLHTTVRGEFGDNDFSNWNDLLRIAHVAAFKKAQSFNELRRVTSAQIIEGSRSDRGFHFIPEINISLQGVDANRGWQYALRLAKYLGVSLRAVVEWRQNEKAIRPGERALLIWKP